MALPVFEVAKLRPDLVALCDPDWPALLSAARRHRLSALLCWHLDRLGRPAAPLEVMTELRAALNGNAQQSLRFGAELVRLVGEFDRAQIPVIAFKGPVLAWTLYETPALREMTDLDLLVPPAHARRAFDLLQSLGFQSDYPTLDWRFLAAITGEVPLTRGSVTVDLHWESTTRNFNPAADAEAAWTRSRRVAIAGGSVPTFGPEDTLLFLAVHGGKHAWSCLGWLADITRLIHREPLDWDAILTTAQSTRRPRALSVALLLAHDLLDTPLPPEVDRAIRTDPTAQRLAEKAIQTLQKGAARLGPLALLAWTWSLSEGLAAKAWVILQNVRPQHADQLWCKFPRHLYPAYYLTRPLRLAAKYATRLIQSALN